MNEAKHGTMIGIVLLAALAAGALLVANAGESGREAPRASPEGPTAATETAIFALG